MTEGNPTLVARKRRFIEKRTVMLIFPLLTFAFAIYVIGVLSYRDPEEVARERYWSDPEQCRGRDGAAEAAADIEAGKLRYLQFGLLRESSYRWHRLLKERFDITVEVVGGCVVPEALADYADAYDARIRQHVDATYGKGAFDKSLEEILKEDPSYQKRANQALVPTPMSVTPAAGAPVAPDTGAAHL